MTEDRRATGIFGVLSVSDNVAVASLAKYLKYGFMLDEKKIDTLVKENIQKLNIKTPSGKTLIQSLSRWQPAKGYLQPLAGQRPGMC